MCLWVKLLGHAKSDVIDLKLVSIDLSGIRPIFLHFFLVSEDSETETISIPVLSFAVHHL